MLNIISLKSKSDDSVNCSPKFGLKWFPPPLFHPANLVNEAILSGKATAMPFSSVTAQMIHEADMKATKLDQDETLQKASLT